MLRREESRHDFAFIAGVIVGAVAGAIATLALTPMSGNETREMIRGRVGDMDEIKERAASVKEIAAERASSVKEMAAERASSVAESAQPMVEKVKTQAAKTPLPVGDNDKNGKNDKTNDIVTELRPSGPSTT